MIPASKFKNPLTGGLELRPGPDLNRCMAVLQTAALPLGYQAQSTMPALLVLWVFCININVIYQKIPNNTSK